MRSAFWERFCPAEAAGHRRLLLHNRPHRRLLRECFHMGEDGWARMELIRFRWGMERACGFLTIRLWVQPVRRAGRRRLDLFTIPSEFRRVRGRTARLSISGKG